MRTLVPLLIGALSVGLAPMQCQSEPPPEQNRYEHPPEALYALAKRFHDAGELKAWRMTLETIIERYPNSRQAVMARDDLEQSERAAPAAETRSDP